MEQFNLDTPTANIQQLFDSNEKMMLIERPVKTKKELEVRVKMALMSAHLDALSGLSFFEKQIFLGSTDQSSYFRKVLSDEDIVEVIKKIRNENHHLKNKHIKLVYINLDTSIEYYIKIHFTNNVE